MQSDAWQDCLDIFNEALEQPPAERPAYLDRACAGDATLRRKVQLLLDSHDQSGDFIDAPAFESAPEFLADDPDAWIGQHLGRYRIDAVLGVGGMGVVYLGCDEGLGRKVGLKLLPPSLVAHSDQLERLKREARTASALNHPNIVTIHEIGEVDRTHYIATEFIEGITLRERIAQGPLPPNEAVEITTQLASALCVAHDAGIVHRDIKPENIMLRRDGYVKVLDFGIAKFTPAADPDGQLFVTTQAGVMLGTTRYMSPEQARSQAVDARSDIWSLGVVLYEMLAGRAPFDGETQTDVMAAVLMKEPLPLTQHAPELPAKLQRVVERALQKDKEARYQTATELLDDLRDVKRDLDIGSRSGTRRPTARKLAFATVGVLLILIGLFVFARYERSEKRVSPAAPLSDKSVAILPFENRSEEKANEYFADGIQDEILTRLSKIADLRVISRSSTQHYKSQRRNLPEIARQLGVAHVVEGSVQKRGDAVRVNVQLIKAGTDSHVWAETFDRKLTDLFEVESEVARAIAAQLQAKLTGREEQVIASRPTDNPEAYDAYLRGLAYSLRSNTIENALGAQKYLREAVRLDPNFALAWALLARVDALGYLSGVLQRTPDLREEARRAAETAVALQPQLGEALYATGFYHYGCLKDYQTAIRYFEQAREFLPNSSRIPEALAYVSRRRGEWEKSIAYCDEAERLDPRNVSLLYQHALTWGALRRFREAERKLDQVLTITPDDMASIAQKAAYAQAQGDLARAASLLEPLRPAITNTVPLTAQIRQLTFERRAGPVLDRVTDLLAKPDPAAGFFVGELRLLVGFAQDAVGDRAAAMVSWRQARDELERFHKDQPENHWAMGELAVAHAALGEKAIARDLVERTKIAFPTEKDALNGPTVLEIGARVATLAGDTDRAIATLGKLLSTTYATPMSGQNVPLTPALLRLDPMFDPLRNDPRFEKLVASSGRNHTSPEPGAGQQITSRAPLPTALGAKSIAVLPFQNLSKDEENAFFADGVQDQILTDLAKVADLKVISRTSVMQYKQTTSRNLREIAEQLGVAHVLEGSVQRAANRVRVNAQLINARTDTHLWSETYDRDLADVFAIQSDIAKAIVGQLQAKLSPREKAAIEQAPTSDVAAFGLYTRAKALNDSVSFSAATKQVLLDAADLLSQAVMRDPSFHDAYCWLVRTHGSLYLYGHDRSPERLALAEAALQAAARLRPDAAETQLARGRYLYLGYIDYESALAELEIARQGLPNDPQIFELTGYIRRRQGHPEEGVQNLQRAMELDPRNLFILQQISISYQKLRRYREMAATLDRALAIKPNDFESQVARGLVEFEWKADTRRLHQAIDAIRNSNPEALPSIADNWLVCALAERDARSAEAALVALGDGYFGNDGQLFRRKFGEGLIARMTKANAKARAAFTAARAEQEKIIQEQPGFGPALCTLAMIDAALGRNDEALRQGRRAVELTPAEKDAINGPQVIGGFAVVAAWVGEKELACDQLETNIRLQGYGITAYGQLKLSPLWDPLRGHPRFEKIVASLAPTPQQ